MCRISPEYKQTTYAGAHCYADILQHDLNEDLATYSSFSDDSEYDTEILEEFKTGCAFISEYLKNSVKDMEYTKDNLFEYLKYKTIRCIENSFNSLDFLKELNISIAIKEAGFHKPDAVVHCLKLALKHMQIGPEVTAQYHKWGKTEKSEMKEAVTQTDGVSYAYGVQKIPMETQTNIEIQNNNGTQSEVNDSSWSTQNIISYSSFRVTHVLKPTQVSAEITFQNTY